MLNEHTLKIKQFFRKLIITNKCYVKKLHIWLFGLIFENYANFFGWQLPLMFLWRKIFGFCWLLSSNMFDLISDCQDYEHPQNFLILPKSPFFPLNLLRFDVACYYAEIPLDPKYDYDEQVKYSFLQEFLANWKKGKEILCVK